ncbi:nuclear cap-binding protein subunit 3-like isoform X1 [Temnothorax curvispinosus]|uniref:Nuclear cap-binding protein subunit 3 n=1 Tax=Temnothorax curvispinosus TaxID=300111 RepID=A0A6J1QA96_9HYME|nr:nuclear cap-binding protein subunit 3-like isoform X1 [Temnothorax curvispinosus]
MEYDEPSDVEMVPIEEIEMARATLKPESQIQTSDSNPERSADTFTTGIDIFSKEERLKMEERAKRFGLTEKSKESNLEEDLYSSMDIVDDGENAKNIRLNVIHMRGTEDMSTKDVFTYFQDYAPTSIEWINDVSCNVVWFDKVTAARAMLGLSKKIVGSIAKYSDRENNDSENRKDDVAMADEENESIEADKNGKDDNCINIKDIDYPLPPGVWRKGVDYPKSKGIFLRFATRADKKPINAEKRSEYYKKYGNPNFGGVKGILTESRKRMYKQTKQNKRRLSIEDKDQDQTKNPWGALSETWGLNDVVEDDFLPKNGVKDVKDVKDQGRSIKERLGLKYPEKDTTQVEESGEASSSSDSDENWYKRSKIPRMRMHADDEEEKVQKRRAKLRFQMILNNLNKSGDLRSKLGRPKTKTQYREPIQVVVTNTNATNSKRDNSGIIRQQSHQIVKEVQSSEREEGEWQESEDEDVHEEEDNEEQRHGQRGLMNAEEEREEGEEEEEGEHKEDEEDSSEEDSDVPAKEIQGPKGSVIKVVPPKPRIASTVWARLNNTKNETSDSYLKKRPSGSRDLRSTLKGGDLRSRIGNHTRGRSPLRIEVKNDKYTRDDSDGE